MDTPFELLSAIHTPDVERRCDNCTHWDSKVPLVGFCEVATEALKLVGFSGINPVRMYAHGSCVEGFEASDEAEKEAREDDAECAYMCQEAGYGYPATL